LRYLHMISFTGHLPGLVWIIASQFNFHLVMN
jgi:hypothetical protein